MTLATRCPACSTVFRVVQDQLLVSDGWVRCGRCGEAFNAREALVEWPPQAVPATPEPPPPPESAVTPPAEPTPDAAAQALAELPPGLEVVATDGAVDFTSPAEYTPVAADEADEPHEADVADVADVAAAAPAPIPATAPAFDDEPTPDAASNAASDAATGAAALTAPTSVDAGAPEAAPAPSFVLAAERAARWRRPGVRIVLALASLLAALGLAAQVGLVYRDRIAATLPATRPLLQEACARLGCRVGDYRHLESLTVESSGLVHVEGAPVYRLALSLRNRGAVEVAAPALDLVVTDAQGQTIARRVLTLADLGLPLRTLRPGSEVPIQAPLAIDGAVSGYTVEIFYP